MEPGQQEALFLLLVSQLRDAAWFSFGRAEHPAAGHKERNLDAARFHIDMLGMLEEKTRDRLSATESRALAQTLTELRMLYVDELGKPETPSRGTDERGGEGAAEEEAAKDRGGREAQGSGEAGG